MLKSNDMATVHKFEELAIWQLAFKIYKQVSVISTRMRKERDFRFADQMKSAAGSTMDNIAEGFARNSRLEFINSLGISKGEVGELQSQSYRAKFDSYINEEEFSILFCDLKSLSSQIAGFIKYLNTTPTRGLKLKNRIS